MKVMINFSASGRIALSALFAGLTCSAHAAASELVIHVAENGNDTADGLSQTKPLQTLQAAIDRAAQLATDEYSRIRISVAPGIYLRQRVVTNGLPDGRTLMIMPDKDDKGRPVFDGAGNGGTWFTLRSATGRASNIGISGLEITNYETAISFNGDRERSEKSNGGNIIRNNVFRNIGQIAMAGAKPSTAVIRFVNSDNNVVMRNRIVHAANVKDCGLLHGVYIAHGSTGNTIEDNVFEDICGDAIRTRDGSDGNSIKDNRFVDAWKNAAISDWYCDGTARDDCTRIGGECPSYGNTLENNTIVSKKGSKALLVATHGPDNSAGCILKRASAPRFIER
jgi:hypothetical protein